jgi:hypothetical protein
MPEPPPPLQLTATGVVCRELAVSAFANASVAGFMFNPLNLVRSRLQLQQTLSPGHYTSMRHCLWRIATEDGVAVLWRYGVWMSMLRETTYGGAQWGLYTPFKKLFGAEDGGEQDSGSLLGFLRKIGAGLGAGAVSSAFITPIDMVMIRQYVDGGRIDPATNRYVTGLRIGSTPNSSARSMFTHVWRSEGPSGMYRGWQPTMVRASLVTVGLTVGYDQTKEWCKARQLLEEGHALHFVASVASGMSACLLSAPSDIVKSRVMANPERYPTWRACVHTTVATEGVRGLFKGTVANMWRLCPAVMVQTQLMEVLRVHAGLDYFGV